MIPADIRPGQIYRLKPNYTGKTVSMKVLEFKPNATLRGGEVMASIVREDGSLKTPERFCGFYFTARVTAAA